MNNREIIESYIPLARFLAAVFGREYEICLHDVSDLEHSLVYIINGQVTDRKAGDGLVNFGFPEALDKTNPQDDFVANVISESTACGGDAIRTSTYFIRDKKGSIIGFLSINQNYSELNRIYASLGRFMNLGTESGAVVPVADEAISAKRMVDTCIREALTKIGREEDSALTKDERRQVIAILAQKNLFVIKGCVNIVAKQLKISVPTLYRYINDVKEM